MCGLNGWVYIICRRPICRPPAGPILRQLTNQTTHPTNPTPGARQEKGQAHGVFFESVPAGQNLPDLGLAPEQQYLYLEAPGLGGKGVQRYVRVGGWCGGFGKGLG